MNVLLAPLAGAASFGVLVLGAAFALAGGPGRVVVAVSLPTRVARSDRAFARIDGSWYAHLVWQSGGPEG
jgi:hypothetical protein